jgi:hypothetical protein
MWKLGLRPRYSCSGNIFFEIWVFCLCSALRPSKQTDQVTVSSSNTHTTAEFTISSSDSHIHTHTSSSGSHISRVSKYSRLLSAHQTHIHNSSSDSHQSCQQIEQVTVSSSCSHITYTHISSSGSHVSSLCRQGSLLSAHQTHTSAELADNARNHQLIRLTHHQGCRQTR